ncbi:MAG: hypothetical protein GX927_13705 [Lentisphaerae bacterium]|nr:hypothetical protein [Lentisphaerota bacterium]
MTSEQNLIQQITRVIENNQLENQSFLEELAAQYSELCTGVNARLSRCSEYLQKGLLSEAVYEAQVTPDLLELAELVQFEQAGKWRVICDDLELTKAPLLHVEALEQLRRACVKEKELQPLLREFRSLIYQGLQHQAIGVLRKIREADPENDNWKANLQTYEEAELPQWLDKAQIALESKDLPVLREVYAELTHPWRVVPAPREALERMQRALLSEKAANLLLEAENMLSRLSENQSAKQTETVRQLLIEASKMEIEDAFYRRPDNWDEQIASARTWLEKAEREARLQAAFEQELQQIRDLLAKRDLSEDDLYHSWRHVQNFGRPLPEALQQSVEDRLTMLQEKRLRHYRRRAWSLTACIALLLLIAGWGIYTLAQQRQLTRIIGELEQDLHNARFTEMKLKLENLQRFKPQVFQKNEVQNLAGKLETAFSEEGERAHLAEQFLSGLEEIRRRGYQRSNDEIQAYLARADLLILTEQEKAVIAEWKTGWEVWQAGKRRESNVVLQRICNQFRSAKNSLHRENVADFELEEKKLQELRLAFQAAMPHVSRAEDLFKEDFQQCQVLLEDWQQDLQQRRQQKAEQDRLDQQKKQQLANLTRELFQALPNLQQYRRQLEQLRNFHDGRMPVEFAAALDNLEQQSKALVLRNFSMRSFPCTPQQEKELRSFMAADGGALGSVWEADLRYCLAYLDKHRQVSSKVRTLASNQQHMFQVYVVDIRRKDATEWHRLYFPALPNSREEKDKEGNPYTLYWGNLYHAESDNEEPHEIHTSKLFPDGLNTMQYDVRVGRRAQDCLSNQGKFLMNFILNAQNQSEIDIFILETLQNLREPAPDMDLIPRTWLQKRLLNFLADHYGEEIPESLNWAASINQLNTDVPWMNPRHPKVLAVAEAIRQAGSLYPDLQPIRLRLKFNRELLARALSRRVQCVGAIHLDDNGNPAPFLCRLTRGELWVLSTPSLYSPARWQILSLDGKTMQPEILHNTFQGQLIFAPQASTFAKLPLPDDRTGLRKPHAWPVNDNTLGF